jgi:hypothetical protein
MWRVSVQPKSQAVGGICARAGKTLSEQVCRNNSNARSVFFARLRQKFGDDSDRRRKLSPAQQRAAIELPRRFDRESTRYEDAALVRSRRFDSTTGES